MPEETHLHFNHLAVVKNSMSVLDTLIAKSFNMLIKENLGKKTLQKGKQRLFVQGGRQNSCGKRVNRKDLNNSSSTVEVIPSVSPEKRL